MLQKTLGSDIPKQAVLLLGGKGKRFRPITYEIPKALLPIKGKTVPEHLINLFKHYNITDLIFSLGYKANDVIKYYGDGTKYGVNIKYIFEKQPVGSAGALKMAKPHLKNNFIVTNGDELKDINLREFYRFHKRNGGKVTVGLTTVNNPYAYGVAKMNGNSIIEFIEKPKPNKAPSNLINSGISMWNSSVLDMIPDDFSMYETDVFPKLAKKKQLMGYIFSGQWFDTGTPERYEKAIKEWKGFSF